MKNYTVAKGVYPRKGVVQPDRSWHVYLLAAVIWISIAVLSVRWAACAEDLIPTGPWDTKGHGYPWGMVTASDVNFRIGPGTEYESLFQWGYGHCVEVVNEQDGWYQVWCWMSDKMVWVCLDYITIVHQ